MLFWGLELPKHMMVKELRRRLNIVESLFLNSCEMLYILFKSWLERVTKKVCKCSQLAPKAIMYLLQNTPTEPFWYHASFEQSTLLLIFGF